MVTSRELVALVKSYYGIDSDYAVAKKLGLKPNSIHYIQKDEYSFSVTQVAVICEILDLNFDYVLASIMVEAGRRQNNQRTLDAFEPMLARLEKVVDKRVKVA